MYTFWCNGVRFICTNVVQTNLPHRTIPFKYNNFVSLG